MPIVHDIPHRTANALIIWMTVLWSLVIVVGIPYLIWITP